LTPSPVVSWGPHGRHCPSVREPCSLCLRCKIRRAGVVVPVRGPILAGTPVRVGVILGAHGPGRPAWLRPGAPGWGTSTCPGRSGCRLRWLRNEGSRPGGQAGRIAPGPGSLLGFPSYESGPLGAPGLHPRQRPPSGSTIYVIAEPLDSVLMTPGWVVPSACPRSQLSACASVGVTESRRS